MKENGFVKIKILYVHSQPRITLKKYSLNLGSGLSATVN
jgi:hypothetical protein